MRGDYRKSAHCVIDGRDEASYNCRRHMNNGPKKVSSYGFEQQLDGSVLQASKDMAWVAKQPLVESVVDHDGDMQYQRRGIDFTVALKGGGQVSVEHKSESYKSGRTFLETVSVRESGKRGCLLTTQSDEVVFSYPKTGIAIIVPTKPLQTFLSNTERFERFTRSAGTSTPQNKGKYHTDGRLISWVRLFHEVPGIRSRVIDVDTVLNEQLAGTGLTSCGTSLPHAKNAGGATFYITASLPKPKVDPDGNPPCARYDSDKAACIYFMEPGLFEPCEGAGRIPIPTLRDSNADFYMHVLPSGDAYICNREALLASVDKNRPVKPDGEIVRSSRISTFSDTYGGEVIPRRDLGNYIRRLSAPISSLSKSAGLGDTRTRARDVAKPLG